MTTTLSSPTATVLTTEIPERRFAPSGLIAGLGLVGPSSIRAAVTIVVHRLGCAP